MLCTRIIGRRSEFGFQIRISTRRRVHIHSPQMSDERQPEASKTSKVGAKQM
jgi:hypothetical protein